MLTMEGNTMWKILISANEEGAKCTLNMEYARAVEKSGGLPFVLPLTVSEKQLEGYLAMADGLLLSGGGDVDPSFYGEVRQPPVGIAVALARQKDTVCRGRCDVCAGRRQIPGGHPSGLSAPPQGRKNRKIPETVSFFEKSLAFSKKLC